MYEYLSGETRSEAFSVESVGLYECWEVVVVGRGHDVEGVLVKIQIRLLAISEG